MRFEIIFICIITRYSSSIDYINSNPMINPIPAHRGTYPASIQLAMRNLVGLNQEPRKADIMKRILITAVACFSFGLVMPRANATAIIDITDTALYSYTWTTHYTLGYSFTVGNTPLTFNALGVFDVISATPSPLSAGHANAAGLSSSHEVGVWDSVGNLIASATVNPGDPTIASANSYGNWVYQTITPTTLTAGTYTIGALFLAGSDPVMILQTAINNAAGVAYVQGYYAGGNVLTLPTGTYPRNEQQYFGPTLLSVPDGGMTLALLGFALVGLDGVRRRIKA